MRLLTTFSALLFFCSACHGAELTNDNDQLSDLTNIVVGYNQAPSRNENFVANSVNDWVESLRQFESSMDSLEDAFIGSIETLMESIRIFESSMGSHNNVSIGTFKALRKTFQLVTSMVSLAKAIDNSFKTLNKSLEQLDLVKTARANTISNNLKALEKSFKRFVSSLDSYGKALAKSYLDLEEILELMPSMDSFKDIDPNPFVILENSRQLFDSTSILVKEATEKSNALMYQVAENYGRPYGQVENLHK